MWWECSECGGYIERPRAPAQCRLCGTAGVIFVPAEVGDPATGEPETDNLRAVWLEAGLEQARLALEHG
jgi:hypothetical protein